MSNYFNQESSSEFQNFEKELTELRGVWESYHKILEALKASEEKYRFLTENSADIIWQLDRNFRFVYISPADQKIRGYAKEEVLGTHLLEIIYPAEVERVKMLLDQIMERESLGYKTQPSQHSLQLICKNKTFIWTEINVNPLRDAKGELIGFTGVTRDITERKRFEEEIKRKNKELEELNDSKDRFFSIISHDLRSPFQGLLGISKLLDDEYDTLAEEEKREFITSLNEALNTQYRFLDDLLSWSRIQSGKISFEPDELYLHDEVEKVIELFTPNLLNKSISIYNNVDKKLTIFADNDMLWLLLRNLISNAIKFTRKNGRIEINSKKSLFEFIIEVKDNGVGISRENIKRLFRIDSHFSTSGTNKEGGNGLGLSLCKEIVERHRGKIWVDSEKDKGTSFFFVFPPKGEI